ncbi:MAG: hypothetical protein ACI9H6_000563 [Patiriisocius sp.]|jgi:hypothetical protein
MESENLKLEVEQTQTRKLNQVTQISKYLAMALFIILPFVAGYIGYTLAPEKVEIVNPTATPDTQPDVPVLDGSSDTFFSSNLANISFTYPSNWTVAHAEENSLPPGVKNPVLLLSENLFNCRIAVAEFDYSNGSYKQASHAARVFSEDFQFDGNWYVNQELNPALIEYKRERQFIDSEIRVSRSSRVSDFVLWNIEGKPVSPECDRDFDSILKTVEYYYEDYTLDNSAEGILLIKKDFSQNKDQSHLVFTDQRSGETYSVLDLPLNTGHGDGVYVVDQKIYTPSQSLVVIDPFAATYKELDIPNLDNTYVVSIYPKDNKLFILAFPSEYMGCLDMFRDGCVGSLYTYDLESGNVDILHETVPATTILGLSKDGRTLYFMGGFGDGSLRSTYLSSYSDGSLTRIYNDATFIGEPEYDEMQKQTQMVMSDIVSIPAGSALKVEAGEVVSVATSTVKSYTDFYILD